MPQIDARPAGLDVLARPGNTLTWTFAFPTGYLDGLTWSATLGGEDLDLAIDGDDITVVASAAITEALGVGRHSFLLSDTTGDDQVRIAGRVMLTETATDSNTVEVAVTIADAVPVEVTVIGSGAAVLTVNGQSGAVVLDAGDVGADPAGTAAAAVATEATARSDADAVIAAALAAETVSRDNADDALDARLDVIEALGPLATDAEVTAAIAALNSTYVGLTEHGTTFGQTSLDGMGDLVIDITTHWGIDSVSGDPYYEEDPADVVAGEEALMHIDHGGAVAWVLVSDVGIRASEVDQEATARAAADAVLQTNITNEATARAAADADLTAALAGFQPLDSDLTAIAALTTTTFGRAFLTMANAGAARAAIAAVPTGVTAWAATTAYEAGQMVTFNDSLWMANVAFTSGSAFDPANWTLIRPGGFGFPASIDVGQMRSTDTMALTANDGVYLRSRDGGTISKIGLFVSTSSGNISVAAYRNSGSGRSAVPATRLATSGAVACPGASAYAEVSLGATVTLLPGDWLFLSADNNTATFRTSLSGAADNNIGLGRQFRQTTAHPAPSPPGTLISSVGRPIVLIGVA